VAKHAAVATLPRFGKEAWAVADQALFAGGNFAVNVLLARWLAPAEFGAFTQAYATFLLLGTVHGAFVIEPMLVFGAGKYRDAAPAYLAALLRGHWVLAALLSLPLLALGVGAASGASAAAWLALAAASPFVLFQWLARRACYLRSSPELAAGAGAIYLGLVLAASAALAASDRLSAPAALAVIAAASLLSAMLLVGRLLRPEPAARRVRVREIVEDHWGYGRWAVGTGALAWVPGSVYYLLLPLWAGLHATAELRAYANLTLPATHAYAALSAHLVPILVGRHGTPAFGSVLRARLRDYAASAVAYYVVLAVAHRPLVDWLYAGRYTDRAALLVVLGLAPIGVAAGAVLGAGLRAAGRPDRVFWAYVWSAGGTATLGVTLTATFGVLGAAIGSVVSSLITVAAMAWFLRGALHATPRP
jgi:O-antigen/teichoic acid export membrane protein